MSDDTSAPSTTSAAAAPAAAPPATTATAQTPEQIREQAFLKYTMDVAQQNVSGSWDITPEQKDLNRRTQATLMDIFPLDDVNKHSDCDLIYRFLIAKRWDVKQASDAIRAYIAFRKKLKLNEVLWDAFPEELETMIRFHTIDHDGRPLYLWRPNPKFVTEMLAKHPRELIVRHFMKVIEQGRRISLSLNHDRMCCLMDLQLMGLTTLGNFGAMGIMKDITSAVTANYPENLRYHLIMNGGYTFSGLLGLISPFIDDRQKKKIINCGSGDNAKAELAKHLNLKNLPISFLGEGPETGPTFRALSELPTSPKGSPPPWPQGAYSQTHLVFDIPSDVSPTSYAGMQQQQNFATAAASSGSESSPTGDGNNHSA